eukprot:416813-Pelagomonas_calceolata.AAC.1
MARLVEGMGSVDSPTHNQKHCLKSDLSTLKSFARSNSIRRFWMSMKLPGWSCAASYFITSHTVEYPM